MKIVEYANKKWKDNYIYFVIFSMVLCLELFFYHSISDEAVIWSEFIEKYQTLNVKTFFLFIVEKTQFDVTSWSSRTIINLVSNMMILLPNAWKILNALLAVTLYKNICEIFEVKELQQQVFVINGILLVPQAIFVSAGWLVTSIAYFWPIAMLVYGLNVLCRKKYASSNWHKIGLILSCLYVANEEIICIFLLFVLPVWVINHKEDLKIVILLEVITVLELIWVFVCPGNSVRSDVETIRFLDFVNLSMIKKMELGFTSTMNQTWLRFSPIMVVFSLVLFIFIVYKNESVKRSLWASVPFLASIFGIIVQRLAESNVLAQKIFNSESKYGSVSLYNYDHWKFYFPLLFYIFVGGSILIIIMNAFDFDRVGISLAFVLLWAVATRCAMGFSPTVWVSSTRTFSLLYYTVLMVLLFFWKKMYIYRNRFLFQMMQVTAYSLMVYEAGNFLKVL